MPTPRKVVVDESRSGVYHSISRCVRRARLCGDGFSHRREWLQKRLDKLVSLMAIEIYAWEILENHLHILLGIRPDLVKKWSDRDVVDRYLRICPCNWRRRARGIPANSPPTDEEIDDILEDAKRVQQLRLRMSSLSWFMAKLKEPIARRANREDDCTGHFWEGRFRCFAVLDEAAILATATYVDLNAVRAGLVSRPEETRHGSMSERAALIAGGRRRTSIPMQAIPGFTNSQYLKHVDRWARAIVPGKRSMPRTMPPILERLGLTKKSWLAVLKRKWESFAGTAIGTADSLHEEAVRRGGQWVCNPLHAPDG
jgi:REP element-mobilizing transposase RayT